MLIFYRWSISIHRTTASGQGLPLPTGSRLYKIYMKFLDPGIQHDEPCKYLRCPHELTIPRFRKFIRIGCQQVKGLPVHQLWQHSVWPLHSLVEQFHHPPEISGVERLGIGTLFPPGHLRRQDIFKRCPQYALLPAVQALQFPRKIVSVFYNPLVGKGNPHFQTARHAHGILSRQKRLHEPVKIKSEHLPHTHGVRVLFRQKIGPCYRRPVGFPQPVFSVCTHRRRTKQALPHRRAAAPGEALLKQNFFPVIPGITAKQLV